MCQGNAGEIPAPLWRFHRVPDFVLSVRSPGFNAPGSRYFRAGHSVNRIRQIDPTIASEFRIQGETYQTMLIADGFGKFTGGCLSGDAAIA